MRRGWLQHAPKLQLRLERVRWVYHGARAQPCHRTRHQPLDHRQCALLLRVAHRLIILLRQFLRRQKISGWVPRST
jgi:hypothetical protein